MFYNSQSGSAGPATTPSPTPRSRDNQNRPMVQWERAVATIPPGYTHNLTSLKKPRPNSYERTHNTRTVRTEARLRAAAQKATQWGSTPRSVELARTPPALSKRTPTAALQGGRADAVRSKTPQGDLHKNARTHWHCRDLGTLNKPATRLLSQRNCSVACNPTGPRHSRSTHTPHSVMRHGDHQHTTRARQRKVPPALAGKEGLAPRREGVCVPVRGVCATVQWVCVYVGVCARARHCTVA